MSNWYHSFSDAKNFGLGYNKVFKPEYLPGRVRFNQFFFLSGMVTLYFFTQRNVSTQKTNKNRAGNSWTPSKQI